MSTLRKENKAKSVKQVYAFLNERFNKQSMDCMDCMFDTSHMGVKMILKHPTPSSVKRPYVINHKTHANSSRKIEDVKTRLNFRSSINSTLM